LEANLNEFTFRFNRSVYPVNAFRPLLSTPADLKSFIRNN